MIHPDWAPTDNPNATVVPGEMRSDREEIPAPFTKEDADKAETMEARQRMSRAAAGCQTYWPSPYEVCGVIRDKYNSLGGPGSFLSFPNSPEYTNPNNTGKRTQFLNGPIYWSAATGAHPVVNSFLYRWGQNNYEAGWLQYPTTDEILLPDGGRRQEFQTGAIYVAFQNAVGSAIRNGPIRDKWNSVGAQAGPLGYVSSDEIAVVKNNGRYNNFVNGTITWSQPTGARLLYGAVRDRWFQLGREDGVLGYPLSDEQATPDNVAHFADFENGSSIWWTLLTGAHEVTAHVRASWVAAGGHTGVLGYPTTNPAQPGSSNLAVTLQQAFQGGVVNVAGADRAYVGVYDGEADSVAEPDSPSSGASDGFSARAFPEDGSWPPPDVAENYDTAAEAGSTRNPNFPGEGTMIIRNGYWSDSWADGWGQDKAEHHHNLKLVESVEFVLESKFRQARSDEADPGWNYRAKAIDQICHFDFTGYECEEVEYRIVHAIYDPSPWPKYKLSPGGTPIGMVSAYCGGGTSPLAGTTLCEPWVDLALLNPED